jgi:hypothetical protein
MESQKRFSDLIDSSDGHLRNASLILGGAVLNRLASTLDAFLSRRAGTPTSLRLVPMGYPASPAGLHPHLTLQVIVP